MMFGGVDGDALAGEASEDDDWAGSPKRRGKGKGKGRGEAEAGAGAEAKSEVGLEVKAPQRQR